MRKSVAVLLLVSLLLCSANNMIVVVAGVGMLAVGMILAKDWRL